MIISHHKNKNPYQIFISDTEMIVFIFIIFSFSFLHDVVALVVASLSPPDASHTLRGLVFSTEFHKSDV